MSLEEVSKSLETFSELVMADKSKPLKVACAEPCFSKTPSCRILRQKAEKSDAIPKPAALAIQEFRNTSYTFS